MASSLEWSRTSRIASFTGQRRNLTQRVNMKRSWTPTAGWSLELTDRNEAMDVTAGVLHEVLGSGLSTRHPRVRVCVEVRDRGHGDVELNCVFSLKCSTFTKSGKRTEHTVYRVFQRSVIKDETFILQYHPNKLNEVVASCLRGLKSEFLLISFSVTCQISQKSENICILPQS